MIKINNKEYKFKFGFKAMILFEKETGKSITEVGENMQMGTLADIAYCGLRGAGEKVTKDWIIDAIDADMGLLSVITNAMQGDMAAVTTLEVEAKK